MRALSRIRHPPPRISIQEGNLTPLASSVVQETKIARDFSVVTLETDAFRSEGASNGTKASEPKRWATSPTRSKGPELRSTDSTAFPNPSLLTSAPGISDPKLSEELFSWRTHRGGGGGSAAEDNLTARSSAMSEDLMSISSDLSEAIPSEGERRSRGEVLACRGELTNDSGFRRC